MLSAFQIQSKAGKMLELSLVLYKKCLSYDAASESVIKPCIKNDNPLVD